MPARSYGRSKLTARERSENPAGPVYRSKPPHVLYACQVATELSKTTFPLVVEERIVMGTYRSNL
jgi:hypothetical protein